MKPENRKFLNDNREVLHEIQRAETCKKANRIRHELLRIMNEEFFPGYVLSEGCGPCVFELTVLLYHKFDALPVPSPLTEEVRPGVVHATFPVNAPKPKQVGNRLMYRDSKGALISKTRYEELYGKQLD